MLLNILGMSSPTLSDSNKEKWKSGEGRWQLSYCAGLKAQPIKYENPLIKF